MLLGSLTKLLHSHEKQKRLAEFYNAFMTCWDLYVLVTANGRTETS